RPVNSWPLRLRSSSSWMIRALIFAGMAALVRLDRVSTFAATVDTIRIRLMNIGQLDFTRIDFLRGYAPRCAESLCLSRRLALLIGLCLAVNDQGHSPKKQPEIAEGHSPFRTSGGLAAGKIRVKGLNKW